MEFRDFLRSNSVLYNLKNKMINKFKIGLMSLAVLSLVLLGAGSASAAAGDLTWSADQTIDLSSPDLNLTIVSGSTASSMVVNAGTLVPTLAVGDVFTVSTEAAGSFSVSPITGVSIGCNSSTIATVVITAEGSQAYTITPSATPCAYQASGGGGGGGGGSYVPLTTTTTTTTTVPGCTSTSGYSTTTGQSCAGSATTTTTTTTVIPGCVGTTGYSIVSGQSCAMNSGGNTTVQTGASTWYNFGTVTLKNGSKGEAVKELQKFLNQVLNLGLVVDGKLGPKTIAVIKKWQKDHGLVVDGLVGPKTKAMMNASVQ